MNKKAIIITIISILVFLSFFSIITYIKKSNQIEDVAIKYSIKERFRYEELDSSKKFVLNERKAIDLAEKAWKQKYGDAKEQYINEILEKKPYVAEFDREYYVWHVYGTAPKNKFAGEPHAIIRQYDGTVLYVWLTE